MKSFNSLKIKELCKSRNMTLKELSERIGLSQTGLQGIFKNNSTSIDTLEKICQVFEVPIEFFFSGVETNMVGSDGITIGGKSQMIDVPYSESSRINELEEQIEDKRKIILYISDRRLIDLAVTAEEFVKHFLKSGAGKEEMDKFYEIVFTRELFDEAVEKGHVRDKDLLDRYTEWKKKRRV
jgi:transcriptional regulator with XRE-family HTH domain